MSLIINLNKNLEYKNFNSNVESELYHNKVKKLIVKEFDRASNYNDSNLTVIKYNSTNGLLDSVIYAYNNHKRLILRPDDILIAISMFICNFINDGNNAELLREQFVDFEDKMELMVTMGPHFNHKLFLDTIEKMIRENTKLDLGLEPDFTTTTDVSRFSSIAVLMSSMQKYFDYTCCLECGIPSVELEGNIEDWELLQEKYNKLKEKLPMLNWWYQYMDLIIETFVKMRQLEIFDESTYDKENDLYYSNKPNIVDATQDIIDLFSKIVTINSYGSGSSQITGWIQLFFYNTKLEQIPFNEHPFLKDEEDKQFLRSISNAHDEGKVEVPIKLIDTLEKEHKLKLESGFMDVEVIKLENDIAFRPLIGYTITEE